MAIDGIGGRGIGDGVTVKESGYTGITLVVKNLTQFQRHGRGLAARVAPQKLPLPKMRISPERKLARFCA
jgi:hypothetical protein